MFIALINLDRTPDRLAEFIRVNSHLPTVTRYAAVDGTTLDVNSLIADRLIEPGILQSYTKGALGVACSHLGLWGIAVQESQIVTVCEDDVILNRHFPDVADGLIAALPADWDMVVWGWNFDSYVSFDMLPGVSTCLAAFDQETMRAGTEIFQAQLPSPRLFRLLRAFGSACYSVSPKGAALLRHHCIPLREMPVYFPGLNRQLPNNGLDIMMNDAYPRMNAFLSFPPLAITKNRRDVSTVQRAD
jgi:glycosyl transferase, family 25